MNQSVTDLLSGYHAALKNQAADIQPLGSQLLAWLR
jgi:hypothetical protein